MKSTSSSKYPRLPLTIMPRPCADAVFGDAPPPQQQPWMASNLPRCSLSKLIGPNLCQSSRSSLRRNACGTMSFPVLIIGRNNQQSKLSSSNCPHNKVFQCFRSARPKDIPTKIFHPFPALNAFRSLAARSRHGPDGGMSPNVSRVVDVRPA